MIVFGFRIPRGSLRGVEEGTHYLNYATMGYAALNSIYGPMVLWEMNRFMEDHGYEAVPMANVGGGEAVACLLVGGGQLLRPQRLVLVGLGLGLGGVGELLIHHILPLLHYLLDGLPQQLFQDEEDQQQIRQRDQYLPNVDRYDV